MRATHHEQTPGTLVRSKLCDYARSMHRKRVWQFIGMFAVLIAVSALAGGGCMNVDNNQYKTDIPNQELDESSSVPQSVLSGCQADCEDGSVAFVPCTGLCNIVNQSCAGGIQGQVTCLATGAVDQCDNQCPCVPRQCRRFECGQILDSCTGNHIDCGPCTTCPPNFGPTIRVTGLGSTCAQALNDALTLARGQSGCTAICAERVKPLLCRAVLPGEVVSQQIDYSFKCSDLQ
jgi:hypothetical protein